MNHNPLILVVEDDAGIYENLRLLLEFNDLNVEIAVNGVEGLKKLSQLQMESKIPNLIISDILMPEMNGYDFLVKVAQNSNWNKIPFIFLSALSYPEDIRLAKSLGVDDYLTKPFKEEELISLIKEKLVKYERIEIFNLDNHNNNNNRINLRNIFDENTIIFFLAYLNIDNDITIATYLPDLLKLENFIKIICKKLINARNKIFPGNVYSNDLTHEFQFIPFKNLNFQGAFLIDNSHFKEINKKYILGVLSNNLTYFDSLIIKKILNRVAVDINLDKEIKETIYYKIIVELLNKKANGLENFPFDKFVSSHIQMK